MSEHTNGAGGALVVRPQQQVGVSAEERRAVAEIQASLTVAKADRRNELVCIDRIKTACQRIGLAEKAEYVYSRGGTEITGPTIDLLTVIGTCWGNISFGFRELTQQNGESAVEAFAWDLETNTRRLVNFTVPHKRFTKGGSYPLTDPRDIYEAVANAAQRRVRACLEAVIPPDIVDDAVAQCRETLVSKAPVTPEATAKLLDAFSKLGVTKAQIEARLQRRLDSMQPAQLVSMRRIYKSLQDGMSKVADWFQPVEGEAAPTAPQTATDAAKEALKKQAAQSAPADTSPAPEVTTPAEPAEVKTEPAPKVKMATKPTISRLNNAGTAKLGEKFPLWLRTTFNVDAPEKLTAEQAADCEKRLQEMGKEPDKSGMFDRQPGEDG
jgi:hypothetical protein